MLEVTGKEIEHMKLMVPSKSLWSLEYGSTGITGSNLAWGLNGCLRFSL